MGSLNDYGQYKAMEAPKRRGFRHRLLRQAALALVLFFLVAATVTAQNWLGDGSRYIVGQGLSPENSWINFSGAAPALGENEQGEDAAAGNVDDIAEPRFTAPASGIVITDLAVAVSGFSTEKGILIQGSEGQSVKAASAGEVGYLGESEDGYIVELRHSGGFTSVYQGLSAIEVAAGDMLEIGAKIGETSTGELTFSLLKDEEEVNPLEYLFQN